MKKSFFTICLSMAIVLFYTTSAFSQSDNELKQKIEKINKDMAKTMMEGNYSVNMSHYTDDAVSMPNNGKMAEGLEAIKKSNEEMAKSGVKVKAFDTKTLKVKSCDKMITEIGTYKMSMTIPGMPNDYEDEGKYLTIWEKQADGSLKIKLEMWNTDKSPMGGGM